MHVDLAIVLTQIIGFILVLMILRRYAWGPMIRILEQRRERIQGEFDQIDSEHKEVELVRQNLEAELRNIEAERRLRIQEAVKEGETVAHQIKDKAHQDAQGLITRAQEQIALERDKAQVQLRNDMVSMVILAAERTIREKLDVAGHRRQVEAFIESLSSGEVDGRSAS